MLPVQSSNQAEVLGLITETNARLSHLSALERIYAALSPCVFGTSLLASYLSGARADEIRARMGKVPAAEGTVLWLHGASAGEIAAASRLVFMLRAHGYRFQAVFTAANRAGLSLASAQGGADNIASLAPWDMPAWIRRALDRWRPAALFLIETELWPRLVFEAYRRKIPVLSLSARIYPRDVPRYRAIRGFIAPTLRRLSRILAQNEVERERFIALGATADQCLSVGNLKHLQEHPACDKGRLGRELGLEPGERLIVFGSLHRQETAIVLEAAQKLASSGVRIVVAPRHLRNARAIAREAVARGFEVSLRSNSASAGGWQILVLDTMGELRQFYAIAAIAIICGGFGRFGGHNPLEAIEVGTPVLIGPHFEHFEHEARTLAQVAPETRVSNAEQIAQRLRNWLGDEPTRRRIFSLQRAILPDSAAIARRYLDELLPYLTAAHA